MYRIPYAIQTPTYAFVFSCACLTMTVSCKPEPKPASVTTTTHQNGTMNSLKAPAQDLVTKTDSEVGRKSSDKIDAESVKAKTSEGNNRPAIVPDVKINRQQKDQKKTTAKTHSKPKRKPSKVGPNIKFERIRHDFGTIKEGDIINYKFLFTNSGKEPLVIVSTNVTCGCTVPSYPFVPIEPGESGHIGVRYNSVGKSGEQKPLITINTNASKEPITLMLFGTVEDKPQASDSLEQPALSVMQDSIGIDSLKGR